MIDMTRNDSNNQLIYYTRLTLRTKELLAVKVTAVVLGVTWLMNVFATFLGCRPIYLYWQVLPHAPQCAVSCTRFDTMSSIDFSNRSR